MLEFSSPLYSFCNLNVYVLLRQLLAIIYGRFPVRLGKTMKNRIMYISNESKQQAKHFRLSEMVNLIGNFSNYILQFNNKFIIMTSFVQRKQSISKFEMKLFIVLQTGTNFFFRRIPSRTIAFDSVSWMKKKFEAQIDRSIRKMNKR